METQTDMPEPETTPPDCHSERLWTALRARWLGRCRDSDARERETS